MFSQVGIGTTDPKAALDIRSTSQTLPINTDGILIPKIDNFPLTVPTIAQDGMMVYYTGSVNISKGFYYWDNTNGWIPVSGAKKIDDLLDGKSDNDGSENGSSLYLGKDAGLFDDSSDNRNVGVGYQSMYNNIGNVVNEGRRNTALGYSSLYTNTNGSLNTAIGYKVLEKNLSGISNTAIGAESLLVNIGTGLSTGSFNTATGSQTLKANTSGSYNTANGFSALLNNTSGRWNTAIGYLTLVNNTSGIFNTAIGNGALYSNTMGEKNIAVGTEALNKITSGNNNVANGSQSLFNNVFGSNNVAIGDRAGFFELSSNKLYIESSDADANNALIYGEFNNDFLRFNADVEVKGSLNVDAGTVFVDKVNNKVGVGTITPASRFSVNGEANLNEGVSLGVALRVNGSEALSYDGTYFSYGFGGTANYFANPVGIGTVTPSTKLQIVGGTNATSANNTGYVVIGPESGENLVIDDNEIMARNNTMVSTLYVQQNGGDINIGGAIVGVSDRRLKRDITQLSYGLKEILQLEPKSYFWKNREQEYKSIGLIAQDVQPIIKEIVHTKDDEAKSLSISYIELIPILINAVKEQEAKIQELEQQLSKNSLLEARLSKLEAQLDNSSKPSKASMEVAKNEN